MLQDPHGGRHLQDEGSCIAGNNLFQDIFEWTWLSSKELVTSPPSLRPDAGEEDQSSVNRAWKVLVSFCLLPPTPVPTERWRPGRWDFRLGYNVSRGYYRGSRWLLHT
jgi:hypothetical protein